MSFDLSSLTRPAQDPYIFPGGNSVYLANVCGIVSQSCPRSPSRKDTTGVQLANGHCLAKIGGLVVPSWATVDENDPGKGVKLTYNGGDHCDTIGRPRSMVLEVLCDPTKHKPEIEGGVEGTDDALCTYTLTMRSAAGCPSHALSTGWTALIIGGIVFSAYCVGGLFWNIKCVVCAWRQQQRCETNLAVALVCAGLLLGVCAVRPVEYRRPLAATITRAAACKQTLVACLPRSLHRREGLTGADAIPNAKAWRELPSLVAGACRAVRCDSVRFGSAIIEIHFSFCSFAHTHTVEVTP